MGDNVRGVQGQLGEIQDAQAYNSKGIFLLLKVVGELAHQNDFKLRSRNELDQFSREPPPLTYGGGPAPVRDWIKGICVRLKSHAVGVSPLPDVQNEERWAIVERGS